MLKDLSFELFECSFDDLCNMRPDVVMKKYGLALLMGSFQLNSLIHVMYLGCVELLVDHCIPFEHFPLHHASQSHQMQVMVFLGWKSGLTLGFGVSPRATHSFLCFIFMYRHHFSSPMTI